MANVNEETRLREELAEARRHAREYRELYEEAEPSLRARATAAESALAEARELIDAARAFRAQREVTASDPNKPGAKSDYEQAALRLKSAASRLFPAALARAGEQAPIPEKQLSGSAGPVCGACAEESKEGMPSGSLHGAGEQEAPAAAFDWPGIAVDLREELYRRVPGTGIVDTWFAIVRKHRIAPAQPAEHPAPSQLSDDATALLTKEDGGTPVYVWRDGSCHPTAEHPASGGEE